MFNFVHIALLAENIWCYVIIRTLLIVFLYFAIYKIDISFYHPAIHTVPVDYSTRRNPSFISIGPRGSRLSYTRNAL